MKNLKLLTLVVAVLLLITGCTPSDIQGENPSDENDPIIANPTTTYLPRPLSNNAEDGENSNACVQIEPNGQQSELNTLLPLIDANFDEAESIQDTKWTRIGNSVVMSITEEGFSGNCLMFTKDATKDASFHSAFIDIAPYIKTAGTYGIKLKFKVVGSDGSTNAMAGVVRLDSVGATTFVPENKDYSGTGTVGVVDDEVWYQYTASLTVDPSDIGQGGKWRLGFQSIQETIETIYIDDVEIFEKSYNAEPQAVTKAQTWVANEVVLNSSKKYEDPYNDVDVDLVLTNGTETYTVPGFWDGGNTWRVRFVCTSEGTWTYETVCTDETDTGLHGQKSTITCTPYVGNLEVYKRGFVKTEDNTRYFMYNDGTPFFYLGDTHWGLGNETIDMVKTIVKTRAEQGYTVFQSEPIGASFKFEDGINSADIAGLKVNDKKFQEIASYGLTHTNASHFFPSSMQEFIDNHGGYSETVMGAGVKKGEIINFYDLSDEAKQALEKACRYWVARYSAYPVMWTLAQEVDNDFFWEQKADFHGHKEWGMANNPYRYVAQYMAKYDPYKHPLSAHMEGVSMTNASQSAFRDIEGHTWYASQGSPKVTGESIAENYLDLWENSQGKPVIRYESYYWMVQTKDFGARARCWMSLLSGTAGCGYGAQGGWYYNGSYEANRAEDDGVDTISVEEKAAHKTDWKGALAAESSIQVTYMRNFFENKVGDWHKLIPRFDDTEYLERETGAYGVIASNEDSSKIVVYFYNFSDTTLAEKPNAPHTGNLTGTLKKLEANGNYKYIWYNPVTGKVDDHGSFTATADGTWEIGEKAIGDMVLYVYR